MVAAWLVGGVMAAPMWAVRFPPMVDYPQQLALAAILRWYGDPARGFAAVYEIWWTAPHSLFKLLVAGLAWVMPIEAAGRLVVAFSLAAVGPAACALCRRAGRPGWYALAALAFVYNLSFFWGFVDNLLAYPLALAGLALADRLFARPRFAAGAWTALAAVALLFYTVHLQFLAVFAGAVVWLALVRRPGARRLALWLTPLLPALLLSGAVLARSWVESPRLVSRYEAHMRSQPTRWQTPAEKLTQLPAALFGAHPDGTTGPLCLLYLLLWLAAAARRPASDARGPGSPAEHSPGKKSQSEASKEAALPASVTGASGEGDALRARGDSGANGISGGKGAEEANRIREASGALRPTRATRIGEERGTWNATGTWAAGGAGPGKRQGTPGAPVQMPAKLRDRLVESRFLTLACWLGILYFLLPDRSQSYFWIAGRLAPFAAMLSAAALPVPPPPRCRLLALLTAALLVLQLGSTLTGFLRFRQETAGVEDLLDHTAPGQGLAGLIYAPYSQSFLGVPLFVHFPAYYQVLKGGRLLLSFAEFYHQPIRFRPGRSYGDLLLAWDEWNPRHFAYPRHAPLFRYFLARGTPQDLSAAFAPYASHLHLTVTPNHWYLVERTD